jgi:hypothetical protein
MTKKRIDHPAHVTLLLLTDADTGRRIAINSGWFITFTEGDRKGTTVFRFMNGELVTVQESIAAVLEAFEQR